MSAGAIRSSVAVIAGVVILTVAVSLAFSAGTIFGPHTGSVSGSGVATREAFDTKALHGYIPPAPGMNPVPYDEFGHIKAIWTISVPSWQGIAVVFEAQGTGQKVMMTCTDPLLIAAMQNALLMPAGTMLKVSGASYTTPPNIPGLYLQPNDVIFKVSAIIVMAPL